jgi:hypothetical protein
MTITMTPRDFILQQSRESDISYSRLLAWAASSAEERRPSAVAAREGVQESHVRDAMRRHRWAERVAPWDDYLTRLVTQTMTTALDETTRDLAKRHVDMWARVREVGEMALARLLDDRGESLTPSQALAFLDAAFKGERLIHGAATEHVAVAVRALDMSGLSTDELRQLRALLAKTGVDGV